MRSNFERRVTGAAVLTSLALILAGCGGGGGGGGDNGGGGSTTPPPANSAVISGQIKNAGQVPVSGYVVAFDPDTSNIRATTNSSGNYTLTIPNADITGTDTVTVFDTTGAVAVSPQTVVISPNGTLTENVLLPPPAPVVPAQR